VIQQFVQENERTIGGACCPAEPKHGLLLRVNQSGADRVADQVSLAVQVQLFHVVRRHQIPFAAQASPRRRPWLCMFRYWGPASGEQAPYPSPTVSVPFIQGCGVQW
jgi:hypothetical protein